MNVNNLARTFTNLMFKGKTGAALELLSQRGKGSVLNANDPVSSSDSDSHMVLDILKMKHPHAQPATPEATPFGCSEAPHVHPVIFDQIDAHSIRVAAFHTKCAAGRSGMDAHCWRRLCTSFKSAFSDLCHSLALLTRRLCTTFVDPNSLSPLMACHLIALDKCPGVRPIGICETARRIISKAVLHATKADLQDAAGPLQLCAGQITGIEAAVHTMKASFQKEDTEAVLLVDASNAFNSLNREAALRTEHKTPLPFPGNHHNQHLSGCHQALCGWACALFRRRYTTQGDPLAMPMYALATIPLINHSKCDTAMVCR